MTRNHGILRYLLLPFALLLLLAACEQQDAGAEQGATTEEVTNEEADCPVFTEENLAQQPECFVGQHVTVSGEVTEVFDPRSFRLGGQDFAEEVLLVVSANNANVSTGQVVRVTGTVREEFAVADFEENIEADLDDEALAPAVGEHYIVADKVQPLPGGQQGQQQQQQG